MDKKFFNVNVSKYVPNKSFSVFRPASLDHPKDNAVMFITEKFIDRVSVFKKVKGCLIFWPESKEVLAEIQDANAVCVVKDPGNAFAFFFVNNKITNLPKANKVNVVNGAYIEEGASLGENCEVFPGVYIGADVRIGNGCYIGAGTKILGVVTIGNNVVVRENTIIGADGLTDNRDRNGHALTVPQFGTVEISDDVQIGANVVIARGAIDCTSIGRGSKIDNSTFISHNVNIGEDTFIVGETIMFGSSSLGNRVTISGNVTISNYVHVGDDSIVGQSSMLNKSIPNGKVAFGNPAKVVRDSI